jgi:hypothetical protein
LKPEGARKLNEVGIPSEGGTIDPLEIVDKEAEKTN